MLSGSELKKYAILSKKSTNDIKKYYQKATSEAKSLGKENDNKFIMELFVDFLDLNESKDQELVKKFILSKRNNFDDFIEELISSDIPQDVRPEMKIKNDIPKNINTTEENEVEEDFLKDINNKDNIIDNDIKDDKNLLYGNDEKI